MSSAAAIRTEADSRTAVSVFGKSYPRDEYTSFIARYPAAIFMVSFFAFLVTIIGLSAKDDATALLSPERFNPVNTLASKLYKQARRADADWYNTRRLLDPVGATAYSNPVSFNGHAVQRLTLVFYFDEIAAMRDEVIPQEVSFLRPNALAYVKYIESKIAAVDSWSKACWRSNLHRGKWNGAASSAPCVPPNSITQYFYPGAAHQTDVVTGPYFPMNGDGASKTQRNIEGMADRIFANPRWKWYFGKGYGNATSEQKKYPTAVKSQFILGASSAWVEGQKEPSNAANIDRFLVGAYTTIKDAEKHPYIRLLLHSTRLEQVLVEEEMTSNVGWRIALGVLVVICFIYIKNRSFFLACFSTAQIWFTYSLMQGTARGFNSSGESVVAVLFLFAVLALSLNSILIYIDTFNHSGVMVTTGGTNTLSVEQRISWTLRKVIRGAFVSHIVVIIVGLILLRLSPVPAIADAGATAIIASLFDLLFFFTYTPSMILFHHFYLSKRRRLLQRRKDLIAQRGANLRDSSVTAILDAIQISRDLKGEKPPSLALNNNNNNNNNNDQHPIGFFGSSSVNSNSNNKMSASANPDAAPQSSFFTLALQIRRAYKSIRNEWRSISRPATLQTQTHQQGDEMKMCTSTSAASVPGSPSSWKNNNNNNNNNNNQNTASDAASGGAGDLPSVTSPFDQSARRRRTSRGASPSSPSSPMILGSPSNISTGASKVNPLLLANAPSMAQLEKIMSEQRVRAEQQQQQQQQQQREAEDARKTQKQKQKEEQENEVAKTATTSRKATAKAKSRTKLREGGDFSDVEGSDDRDDDVNDGTNSSPSTKNKEDLSRKVSAASGQHSTAADIIEEEDIDVEDHVDPSQRKHCKKDSLIEEAANVRGMAEASRRDDSDESDNDTNREMNSVRQNSTSIASSRHQPGQQQKLKPKLSFSSRARGADAINGAKDDLEDVVVEDTAAFEQHTENQQQNRPITTDSNNNNGNDDDNGDMDNDPGIISAARPKRRVFEILKRDEQEQREKHNQQMEGTKAPFTSAFYPNPRQVRNQPSRGTDEKLHPMAAALAAASRKATGGIVDAGYDETKFLRAATAKDDDDNDGNGDGNGDDDDRDFDDGHNKGNGGAEDNETREGLFDAFADAPVSSSVFLSSRMVQKKKLVHIPASLCFRNEHAREHVVRVLTSGDVDPNDEFSGLDPDAIPLAVPFLPSLATNSSPSAAAAAAGAGSTTAAVSSSSPSNINANIHGTIDTHEELLRSQIVESCEEAGSFIRKWMDASKKLGIMNAEDERGVNSSGRKLPTASSTTSGSQLLTVASAQRVLTAYFLVQQQCFQNGGSSICEYILNAPALLPKTLIAQQEEQMKMMRQQQDQQQDEEAEASSHFSAVVSAGANGSPQNAVSFGAPPTTTTTTSATTTAAPLPPSQSSSSRIIPVAPLNVAVSAEQEGYGEDCCHDLFTAWQRKLEVLNEERCSGNAPRRKYWCFGARLEETQAQRDARLLHKSQHVEVKVGLLEEYVRRFFNDVVIHLRYPLLVAFLVVFILSAIGISKAKGRSTTFQTLDNFNENEKFAAFARNNMYEDEYIDCDTCGAYFRDSNELFPLSSSLVSSCGAAYPGQANLFKDKCGVCMGNDGCVDCSGTPNGSWIVDRCGTCLASSSPLRDACTDPTNSSNWRNCTGNHSLCTFCEEQYGPRFRNMGGPKCDVRCDESTCKKGKCDRWTGRCECFRSTVEGYYQGASCDSCVSYVESTFGFDVAEFGPQPNPGDLWGSCYDRCLWQSGPRPFDLCRNNCEILTQTGAFCRTGRVDLCANGGRLDKVTTTDNTAQYYTTRYLCVECWSGYTGDRCAYQTACKGRGIRTASGASNLSLRLVAAGQNALFCQCSGFWTGMTCDVCACKNGGQCMEQSGKCACPAPWTGPDCGTCAETCRAHGTCPPPYSPQHYSDEKHCAAVFCSELELLTAGTCAACQGFTFTPFPYDKVCLCSGFWSGAYCHTCYDKSVVCTDDGRILACDGGLYTDKARAPVLDGCGACRYPWAIPEHAHLERCAAQSAAASSDTTDIFLYIGLAHPLGDSDLQSVAFHSTPVAPPATSAAWDASRIPLYDLGFEYNSSHQQFTISVLCDRLQDHETGDNVWSYLTLCPDRKFLWWVSKNDGTPMHPAKQYERGLPPSNINAPSYALSYLLKTQDLDGQLAVQLRSYDRLDFPPPPSSTSATAVDRISFLRYRLQPAQALLERDDDGASVRRYEVLRRSIEAIMSVPAMFASQWWVQLSFKNQAYLTLNWVVIVGFLCVGALTNILQRSALAALITVLCVAGACVSTFAILIVDGFEIGTVELMMLPAIFAITCAHSIHMIEAYGEVLQASQSNLFAQELSRSHATREAVARSGPALLTSTAAILLVCAIFSTSPLVPLQRAASFSALAVFCSSVFSLIFLPALLAVAGPETYYSPWVGLPLVAAWAVMCGLCFVIIGATGGVVMPDGDVGLSF